MVVAHLLDIYLPLSQTFIYQYIKNLDIFRPIVIAGKTDNLDLFPINHNIYCLGDVWKRWTWKWMEGRINERILNKSPYETVINRIFAKEKPKLLHAHSGIQGVENLYLQDKHKLPLITTFYGMDMSKMPKQKEWQKAYKELFAKGDLFLVEGPHMRDKVIELGCPQERVKIQHIAVNLDDYDFKMRKFPEDGIIKILMCCRFTEKKGVGYALHTLNLIKDQHEKIELRIIGDGELRQNIEILIKGLGLREKVILLGYQPHSRFIKELKNAHIFLA
ncbi:colanic acid biosynthesis glycosyltransferase WcaL, partial [Candidatus Poribacteria bacterium]|nr:colanic acid biosynthesis glycosyltransferase WcaL [Candidatus Poribacteria bacterium]